jgi:DNA-binding transcriptional LysR family regulator
VRALEEQNRNYRIVFTSSSFNSKIAATKAGLGLTVLPKSMIPGNLCAITHSDLPVLHDTHISLLKHNDNNPLITSFADFIIKKLKH